MSDPKRPEDLPRLTDEEREAIDNDYAVMAGVPYGESPEPTPGPWAVTCQRDRTGAYNDIEAAGLEWPDNKIALVSCDNPKYRANCRLIAAAPELKDRLSELLDMLDGRAPLDTGPARSLLARISERRQ